MDLSYEIHLERAENELDMASIAFAITENKKLQEEVFHLEKTQTFFSSVISHSYYCIFYSAKAYLLKKGKKISAPEEHKKSLEEFKKYVDNKMIDYELFRIYEKEYIKAETLLGIFKTEKEKRSEFTYQKIAQANREPAIESIKNAKLFLRNIGNICRGEIKK